MEPGGRGNVFFWSPFKLLKPFVAFFYSDLRAWPSQKGGSALSHSQLNSLADAQQLQGFSFPCLPCFIFFFFSSSPPLRIPVFYLLVDSSSHRRFISFLLLAVAHLSSWHHRLYILIIIIIPRISFVSGFKTKAPPFQSRLLPLFPSISADPERTPIFPARKAKGVIVKDRAKNPPTLSTLFCLLALDPGGRYASSRTLSPTLQC